VRIPRADKPARNLSTANLEGPAGARLRFHLVLRRIRWGKQRSPAAANSGGPPEPSSTPGKASGSVGEKWELKGDSRGKRQGGLIGTGKGLLAARMAVESHRRNVRSLTATSGNMRSEALENLLADRSSKSTYPSAGRGGFANFSPVNFPVLTTEAGMAIKVLRRPRYWYQTSILARPPTTPGTSDGTGGTKPADPPSPNLSSDWPDGQGWFIAGRHADRIPRPIGPP